MLCAFPESKFRVAINVVLCGPKKLDSEFNGVTRHSSGLGLIKDCLTWIYQVISVVFLRKYIIVNDIVVAMSLV